MVNNLVFRWPKPLFFMVLGAHGRVFGWVRDRKLVYFTYLRDVFTTYLYRGEFVHPLIPSVPAGHPSNLQQT